jgi:hypothetical protein
MTSFAVGGVVGEVGDFTVRTTHSVSNWLVGSPPSHKETAPANALRRLNATNVPSGSGWTNTHWQQFIVKNNRDVTIVVNAAKKDSNKTLQDHGLTLESNYNTAKNYASHLSLHPSDQERSEMKNLIENYLRNAREISSILETQ